MSRREFSETRHSNRHISLKGPNKSLPDLLKFDTVDLQTMPYRNYKFCEKWCSKIRTLPKGVHEVLTVLSTLHPTFKTSIRDMIIEFIRTTVSFVKTGAEYLHFFMASIKLHSRVKCQTE